MSPIVNPEQRSRLAQGQGAYDPDYGLPPPLSEIERSPKPRTLPTLGLLTLSVIITAIISISIWGAVMTTSIPPVTP